MLFYNFPAQGQADAGTALPGGKVGIKDPGQVGTDSRLYSSPSSLHENE